jgi:FMN reductase
MSVSILALNGSPAQPSRSRALAERALELAGGGRLVDLATLDPAALLALGEDPGVEEVRDAIVASDVLIVATPVYRATYTALTKTIFDLLPMGSLEGTAVVPIATGFVPDHSLSVDHGLRPLVASLGGWTVPTGVYAARSDVGDDGVPSEPVATRLAAAVTEALTLAHALR